MNRALTDTLAARVALFGKTTDGHIINSITGNDRGNEDSLSYRASLLWDLEQFSALFTYDHFEANERAPLGSCRFTGASISWSLEGWRPSATCLGFMTT